MTIVKLSEIKKYKKFQIIRKAGFDTIEEDEKFILIDKESPLACDYADVVFNNLDDIIRVLSEYLLKVGYIIIN
jgi:hypothetical protein